MLTLVIGGAASGKSAYAEHLAVQSGGPHYYLATMQVWDAECAARVAKHRAMRAQKQFATVECPQNLHLVRLPQQGTALLEDLGNLAANELYRPDGSCLPPKQAAEKMLAGIEAIAAQCNHRQQRGIQRRGGLCRGDRPLFAGPCHGQQCRCRQSRRRLPRGVRPAGVLQRRGTPMTVLQTIAVAFAMFSAVPVPQFDWNEKNMRYSLCAFPLVGVLCGVLWYVCASLPLPAMVCAAGFCLIPVWVTGGIHLDGYADTCDALCSYGDTQKKLDILKDPHCGAFAVIRLCSYFVAYFALCCCVQFTPQVGAVWLLALVLERACSGYAVAAFPLAKNTGLAHTFATAADRITVRRVLGCLSIVLAVALFALGGGVLALAAGVALWRYHRVAVKQFGGITGDLAGWFLQKAELYMLAALVFCQWKGFL